MADAGRDRHAVEYALAALIADTRRARAEVAARLEEGRDRLLEWSSARPALSGRIIEQIRHEDADRTLDAFMLLVFDLFVIQVEEVAPRSWRLGSAGVLVDEFPGLKAEGMTVTRDRARALDREDLQFLTWDHPLATGALDLLLGSEKGNCAFAHWVDPDTAAVHLDAVYVLECLAPPALHADRFLPPTPLRTVVDHRGGESEPPPLAAFDAAPHPALARTLVGRSDMRDRRLPRMIEQTRSMAERQAAERRREAASQMEATLRQEIGRLRDLQRLNGLVRDEEIAALEQQQQALGAAIAAARVRLDAVRLVYRGPRR
jgi:ATP-dependent helicase HepA